MHAIYSLLPSSHACTISHMTTPPCNGGTQPAPVTWTRQRLEMLVRSKHGSGWDAIAAVFGDRTAAHVRQRYEAIVAGVRHASRRRPGCRRRASGFMRGELVFSVIFFACFLFSTSTSRGTYRKHICRQPNSMLSLVDLLLESFELASWLISKRVL